MGKWLCSIAVFLLALPGCGTDETPTRLNTFTPLTSIVIKADLNTLAHGTSTRLTAIGNFSGIFTRDITSEVTWSSDQPTIADFPSDFPPNRVQALVAGVATITATTPEGITGSLPLTVTTADIATVTVSSPSASLPMGSKQAFTAQGTFNDNSEQDLTFDAVWASSEIFATVSNEVGSKGMVSGVSKGTTSISATFNGISGQMSLIVTDPILLSLAVTPANPSLLSLSTTSFSATGTYSDQSTRDITAGVTWGASDPFVATIVSASTVKALAPGSSTISATLGTISGTSALKVTGGKLVSIALTLDQVSNNVLIKDTLSRITARGTFDNGTSRDITGLIDTWSVVDNTKASFIDDVGNLEWVKALADTPLATPATLSATSGSVTGQSTLTVSTPTLSSVSIPTPPLTLVIGTSGRLSLSGTFSPANSQKLTPTAEWSSATTATATVGNIGLDKGRVKALAAGPAEITATYGGQTATTTVTVVAKTLESLNISAVTTPAKIIAGTEKEFKVTAHYTDGFEQDVTADATWTINDVDVAKFSDQLADPGLVVAVDAGTAILTATFGGLSDTETLVVSP